MLPMCFGEFCNCDKIIAQVNAFNSLVKSKELFGEGGAGEEGVVFAGDVEAYVGVDVIIGCAIVVIVVYCNFLAIFEFTFKVVFDIFWNMTEYESTVGDKFKTLWVGRRGCLDEQRAALLG